MLAALQIYFTQPIAHAILLICLCSLTYVIAFPAKEFNEKSDIW